MALAFCVRLRALAIDAQAVELQTAMASPRLGCLACAFWWFGALVAPCFVVVLVGWWVGWLVGWFVGWFVGWLVGWLAGVWLVGWLVAGC